MVMLAGLRQDHDISISILDCQNLNCDLIRLAGFQVTERRFHKTCDQEHLPKNRADEFK